MNVEMIESDFTPLWEEWHDPGPEVCGAGVRCAGTFVYLAGIDGACTITFARAQDVDLDLCRDIAQEECTFAQVDTWDIHQTGARVTLTIEEWDESTAVDPEEAFESYDSYHENNYREDWDR